MLSARLTVALDGANNEIDLDAIPNEIAAGIDLDDLADINAAAPADGEVLTWDAVGSKWVPEVGGGGAGGGGIEVNSFRRSGLWYFGGGSYINYTLTTMSASRDTLYAYPFFVNGGDQTFDTIGIYVITGQVGGVLRLGIYDDDGDCYPNNLEYGTAELDGSGSGAKTEAITLSGGEITLSPGLYWLAFLSDATSSNLSVRAVRYTYATVPILGFSALTDITPETSWSVAQAYGAMPSTFTGGATAQAAIHPPAVGLKRS